MQLSGLCNWIVDYPSVFVLAIMSYMSATGQETLAKRVNQEPFTVVGIEVRTNNASEASGNGAIPKQWEKFFKDGVSASIPNKTDSSIVVVYSNYQSDRNGDYDYLIGARVKNPVSVPPGMVAKKVAGGTYSIVTTPRGAVSKVIPETWQKIWKLEEDAHLSGVRAYKTDFEVYDERSQDPQNSQVDIYIGLK